MKRWLLLLAACDHAAPAMPDAKPEPDELVGEGTVGADNQIAFRLELGFVDRVIAQGATFQLAGYPRSTAPAVASVTAEPPILTFDTLKLDEEFHEFYFNATSIAAGDTELVARDASGGEIDRVALQIRPTDTLALDGPVTTAHVLAGALARFHVTTYTAGVVTVGTGAVAFALNGLLRSTKTGGGDAVYFMGGTGSIDATAPDATAHVDLVGVDISELTSLTPSALDISDTGALFSTADVGIAVTASGVPIYGAQCTWTTIPGLTITGGPRGIGGTPGASYSMYGDPGTYAPTCTIGSLSTTITVHLQ